MIKISLPDNNVASNPELPRHTTWQAPAILDLMQPRFFALTPHLRASVYSVVNIFLFRSIINTCLHRALQVTVLFLLMSLCSADAAIYVDITATAGSNNGSSWANAYTNLNTALTKATGEELI